MCYVSVLEKFIYPADVCMLAAALAVLSICVGRPRLRIRLLAEPITTCCGSPDSATCLKLPVVFFPVAAPLPDSTALSEDCLLDCRGLDPLTTCYCWACGYCVVYEDALPP